jgi:hypothetical protein
LFVKSHPYPLWKLLHDPAATGSTIRVILLCYAVLVGQFWCESADCSILDFLLDRGLLSARTRTRWMPQSAHVVPDEAIELTVWQYYLLFECIHRFFRYTQGSSPHDYDESFAAVAERFLRRATRAEWNDGFAYRMDFEVGREKTRFSVLIWKHKYDDEGDGAQRLMMN